MKYCIKLILLLASKLIFGQSTNLDVLRKAFPDKALVYNVKDESIEIINSENGLHIVNHVKEQITILTDNARDFNTRSIHTNSFIEIKNVKAYNYVPNGNKLTKVLVDDIKVKDASNDDVFYDENKKIIVTYPTTIPGSVIEIEYDEIYHEPRFFGAFYISEYFPVIKATCKLKLPKTVNVNVKLFNINSLNMNKSEKSNKSNTEYIWSFDSVKPIVIESYSPSYKTTMSHLLFNVIDYKQDNKSMPLVGSIDNLYTWYINLTKNLNKTSSPALKHITDSLISGCKTDIEKLEKIYYWVQDKISYIAYEDGLGGYIPREAEVVCKRRFGDCKDMASVLNAMGAIAHLPIKLTWIGTRDIPYQFSEVPAPMSANHMIATYMTNDTTLFLDATGDHQDLGTHTAFIQGKEAIISLNELEYKIKKVPILKSTLNFLTDSIVLNMHNRTLEGTGYIKVNGYPKVNLLERLSGKSYKEQLEYLSSYCQKGNNKFKLDSFSIFQNQRGLPLIINYQFKLSDYITEVKNESFLNLNFDKNYLEDYSTLDRKLDYKFSNTFEKKLSVTLNLSPKQSLNYIPANVSYKKNNYEYIAEYTKSPTSINFSSKIAINTLLVPITEFGSWNDFLTEVNKNNNKTISLNKL